MSIYNIVKIPTSRVAIGGHDIIVYKGKHHVL